MNKCKCGGKVRSKLIAPDTRVRRCENCGTNRRYRQAERGTHPLEGQPVERLPRPERRKRRKALKGRR